jgi:GcrA cell cycle regulator
MPQSTSSIIRRGCERASGRARGGWDAATVEVLTRLWSAGDLSASAIARRLGVTRNAVLGKVHRLGLSNRRPGHVGRTPRPKPEPRRAPAARKATDRPPRAQSAPRSAVQTDAATAPMPSPLEDLPGLVPHLEDLSPRACHWPCGDPAQDGFCFCGREADPGPYCPTHDRIAHRAQPARPLRGLAALLDS